VPQGSVRPAGATASGSLAGWRTLFGTWRVAPDGALVGTPARGGEHAHLICAEDFGDRFEVRVRIDALSPVSVPGITFGRGPSAYAGEVRVAPAHLSLLDRADGHRTHAATITAPVEMTVRCDAGRVDVRVNDREWTDLPFKPAALRDLRVGVGAQTREPVRFSGLKIRKLRE
jgi:hypothetical protein